MQTTWLQKPEDKIYFNAATFRLLLDCLSRPGKIIQLTSPEFLEKPPSPYHPEFAGVPLNSFALGAFLSLLDGEVSFAVGAGENWIAPDAEIARWLTLRCGSRLTAPGAAAQAFFCEGTSVNLIRDLHQGTLLEPELSATVFYCVEKLAQIPNQEGFEEQGLELELKGPGILNFRRVFVLGMARDGIAEIAVARHYPLGVDVFLVDRSGFCIGLPRTTKIEVTTLRSR
ncbi:phosphonate C-P lyase system protein PhnH [Candidatus Chlorohelix sp.]|uniref:phosphonate C-P lyase system protein PhnH n=1 Tax=Candidatus Chlorohelix sp. TaxID=3139201 RepID=UPI00305C3C28